MFFILVHLRLFVAVRHDFAKVYLKTKKMTDISQTQAGCKAKSRRNPLWIPRLFNAKSRCVCRNRRYFRLFRYTLVKRCHARGRHTFGKYVQTGNAAKLAANLAYYIIPARQIKPINPQKSPLFLRQFYKSGQNARQSRCSLYRTFTSWWLNSSWTASKISASQPTQAKAKPR